MNKPNKRELQTIKEIWEGNKKLAAHEKPLVIVAKSLPPPPMKLTKNSMLNWNICPYLGVLAGIQCRNEPNKNKQPHITHTLCNIILYGGGKCSRKGNCITTEIIKE